MDSALASTLYAATLPAALSLANLRILMVSDVYFPRVNGVSTSIQTFRRALAMLGHESALIAPHYGKATADDDEADILRLPARRVPMDPEDRLMSARAVTRHDEALSQQPFDLVHIQTPFVAHRLGVKLARRMGVPVVASYHTYFEEYLFHYLSLLPKSWMRWAARALSRQQCRQVDGVIVPSAAMKETLHRYGVTTPMRIIPTGIDITRFTRGDGRRFRREHGVAPERRVLLYVGRVAFEKNIEFLIDVVQRLRDAHPDMLLVIAGEGPAETALHRKVDALGLGQHVKFVGYLDRDSALLDCYRAADLFVFASRTETQGLVLLEAMAVGLPVVALAEMGTRDVLREGRGCAIARNDLADFADKVAVLLNDPRRRRDLAETARVYAQAWGARAYTDDLVAFYRTTLERRRAQPVSG